MWKKEGGVDLIFYLILFIILSAALFIRIYNLGERSLWLDEAWVANAIIQADLHLVVKQSLTAPLFFVLSIHYLTVVLGKTEFVLRLLPCLFGLGTLFLFYLLIKRITGKTATLLTLLMLSFSYQFIHYSKELKQYSGAMFFSLLLVYCCEKLITSNKNKDWILFPLFCMLGVGFDHSLLFIVPSVFAVLLITFPLKNYWKKLLFSGGTVFIFSGLFFFFHIQKQISSNIGSIQKYWLAYYPNLSSLSSFLNWFVSSLKKMFHYFGLPFFSVSLLIVFVGLSLFYKKRKKRFLIYIILPFLLTLSASILKRYPFGGSRLMLFFAPLLYLAFGNGLDFIFKKLIQSKVYIPFFLIIIFLAFPPISNFAKMAESPLKQEELKPVMKKLQKHIQPRDKIYVYYGAKEAFEYYYRTKYYEMIETQNIIWGESHRGNKDKYVSEITKYLKPEMRIWMVFSHYWGNERSYILNYLHKKGKLMIKLRNIGASAFLFKIKK